jgi:predicted MFS family arabinose efflux permease
MSEEHKLPDFHRTTTRNAYILTRVLDTPFWGIFNLLPFILYKDLHATPFQLASLVSIKPIVSILSSYWANRVFLSSFSLSKSIIIARMLAFIPFLAFPFVSNVWYMIACFGLFMFLQVAMMPAWMELLRQNVPEKSREKVFSYTQAFGYFGGGLLPFVIGWILDEWESAWRWTFFVTALLGTSSCYWQCKILERPSTKPLEKHAPTYPLLQPWKSAFNLLKERPDFAKFQIGFMLIGSGLMIIQPVLPLFFVDQLHLSYTLMGVSITLCKGIGFAVGSPLWVRLIQHIDIFYFGSIVAMLAVCFPLLLLGAQVHLGWAYIAYLIYGLMQSGNELSWNLSGPMFARKENSSPYSNINIMASGIRGIFIPTLGAFILSRFGLNSVMLISGILCFLAAIRMALYSRGLSKIYSST